MKSSRKLLKSIIRRFSKLKCEKWSISKAYATVARNPSFGSFTIWKPIIGPVSKLTWRAFAKFTVLAIFKGRKWVCYVAKIFKSTTCLANDGKHSLILSRKICKSTNDRFQKLTWWCERRRYAPCGLSRFRETPHGVSTGFRGRKHFPYTDDFQRKT